MFNHHLEVTKVTETRTSKIAQNVTFTPPMYFFCSLAKRKCLIRDLTNFALCVAPSKKHIWILSVERRAWMRPQ